MKKRRVSILLAMMLAFSVLVTGCGSSSDEPEVTVESSESEAPAEEPAEEEPEAEAPAEEPAEEEESKSVAKVEAAPAADIDEITVVDNDECSVIITSLEEDDSWGGYEVKVALENKSSDKTYTFSASEGAINGITTDPLLYSDVAPGKKANDEATFYLSDDEAAAIGGDITDIELTIRVYDSDDYSADDVANETVHIYPTGEENATTYIREDQEDDVVLVDNDDVKVVIYGTEEDDIWGYSLLVYMENKTDRRVMFTVDDASVNGYMSDPFWASSVAGNKVKFGSISWSESTLSDSGIDDMSEISEIEFNFRAYDYDDYSAPDMVNETFTLTVE